MEAPKVSHKKKTDRDREKERLEKEMMQEAIKLYRQRQEAVGKPVGPREPLKRTVGNNWVHVTCAVWTPEIRFGHAKELEPAEGFCFIPGEKYREVCKICKSNKGACVPCHHSSCNAHFHVGCAFHSQYRFGFDITPVKSSRRDSVNSMRLGQETGAASAAIWCPHHQVSGVVHDIGEMTEKDGTNALQRFVQTYKQADLTLTGTLRKAAHVQQSVGASQQHAIGHRRASGANGMAPVASIRDDINLSSEDAAIDEMEIDSEPPAPLHSNLGAEVKERHCVRCSTAFSPRWWPVEPPRRMTMVGHRPALINGIELAPPSTSPPFHSGAFPPPSALGLPSAGDGPLYECHKCHLKSMTTPQPTPEPRHTVYATPSQRPVLPAPRLTDYAPPYGAPHAHATPPGIFARPAASAPPPPPSGMGHEWYPGYDHGITVPPGYAGPPPATAPPPPPPTHHLNGYQHAHTHPPPPPSHSRPPLPTHGPPPPPHFPNGAPLPPAPPSQSYPTHHSPYRPMSVASPRVSQATVPRPYASSASPPEAQATMVRHSPQHSLSALNGGPPPRMYSAERVLSAPVPSPPVSQVSPVERVEGTPVTMPPTSRVRQDSVNGGATGASASPSLKNLLS